MKGHIVACVIGFGVILSGVGVHLASGVISRPAPLVASTECGLTWYVYLAKARRTLEAPEAIEAFNIDGLLLDVLVRNDTGDDIEFAMFPDDAPVEIRLTCPDGTVRVHEIDWLSDCRQAYVSMSRGATVMNRQLCFRFILSLKEVFGILEPGEYSVQVVMPAEGYGMSGVESESRVDLMSPAVGLSISAPDFQAVLDAVADDDQESMGTIQRTVGERGTLTNTSDETVWVPVRPPLIGVEPADPPQPPTVLGGRGHWHPDNRWGGAGGGRMGNYDIPDYIPYGEEWDYHELTPGESMEIMLPVGQSDGIYRYSVVLCDVAIRGGEAIAGMPRGDYIVGEPFLLHDGQIYDVSQIAETLAEDRPDATELDAATDGEAPSPLPDIEGQFPYDESAFDELTEEDELLSMTVWLRDADSQARLPVLQQGEGAADVVVALRAGEHGLPLDVRFHLDDTPIELVLTDSAGTEHRLNVDPVDARSMVCRQSGLLTVGGLDLVELCGELPVGEYELVAILPAEGYSITNAPALNIDDLVSEPFAFEVVSGSPEGISQSED